MASKMKKTKKQRTHKTSPNTAGTARGLKQERAHAHNETLSRTPWEKAKDKRFHSADRVAKRKAWEKKNSKRAKVA